MFFLRAHTHTQTQENHFLSPCMRFGMCYMARAQSPEKLNTSVYMRHAYHTWLICEIPDGWIEGVIVRIQKKCDLNDCKNYRGNTFLNTIQKLIAFIILDRISPSMKILQRREQLGFMDNRSCVDHICSD